MDTHARWGCRLPLLGPLPPSMSAGCRPGEGCIGDAAGAGGRRLREGGRRTHPYMHDPPLIVAPPSWDGTRERQVGLAGGCGVHGELARRQQP